MRTFNRISNAPEICCRPTPSLSPSDTDSRVISIWWTAFADDAILCQWIPVTIRSIHNREKLWNYRYTHVICRPFIAIATAVQSKSSIFLPFFQYAVTVDVGIDEIAAAMPWPWPPQGKPTVRGSLVLWIGKPFSKQCFSAMATLWRPQFRRSLDVYVRLQHRKEKNFTSFWTWFEDSTLPLPAYVNESEAVGCWDI